MWSPWKKRFEYMVLFGVMGELLADGGIFLFSSHLQTISDIEVAGLKARATDAESKLAGAIATAESAKATAKGFESAIADSNLRAKNAEAQTASANAASKDAVAKVSTAEARIAEAELSASEAKKETARLNKEAEVEHLARVKIEEAMADRVMTPEQFVKILNGIKLKPIQSKVMISPLIGYPEAGRYAGQFSRVLNAAGVSLGWSGTDKSTLYGVWVCPGKDATIETKTDAINLRDILIGAGILVNAFLPGVSSCVDSGLMPGQIELLIGAKAP